MKFGYFTLSDNRYPDNPRSSADFLHEICDQAVYAEKLGMNSAWIGEHHFNRRGCVSTPALALANIAARTERIRLGPAVVVLPIHHPIHVAEEWAALDQLSRGRVDFSTGRGYDSHEYGPFGADFQSSAEIFAEGLELLTRCWTETEPFSFNGDFYDVHDLDVHPKPFQDPFRPYMGSFSEFSMELAAQHDWNLLLAPFAASIVFGGLGPAVAAYRDICAKRGQEARKVTCSYFIHIGESEEDRAFARDRLMDYFTLSGLRKKTSMGGKQKLPPTMQYYKKIGEALANPNVDDFGIDAILYGSTEQITERLTEVASYGIDEVILYFNYGCKPDSMVREQMDQFVSDIAPALGGVETDGDAVTAAAQ